jgi:SAM-dependent methyltransferase
MRAKPTPAGTVAEIHEANRQRWNSHAAWWKRLRDEDGLRPRRPAEPHLAFEGRALETIDEFVGELKGKTACVVGSGDNYAAFALAGLGMEVASVDISEEQLKDAASHASELGLDIGFVRADAADMPSLADGSFDLVCSTNGFFIWLADLSVVFSEIARILKPGGHYVFYDVHPLQRPWKDQAAPIKMIKPYWDRTPHADGAGETHWTLADILNALIEAGLDVRRVVESAAANSRFWEGPSYGPGEDESLQDWMHNPRAGLPVWLTVAAVKGGSR